MLRRRFAAAAAILVALPAAAQDWPAGPVRGIVPFAPGSATDTVARLVAERMRDTLGQPVVVENRTGAGGLIGAEVVAKAAPDGMTLLFGTNSTNAAADALFKRVPYDMAGGFVPISTIAAVPLLVAVAADGPHRTLAALIAAGRARPEALTFASASASQRLGAEMLASMAGMRLLHVPYRSSPLATQDLMAGRVDLFVADQAVILPGAQSGRLRILAVTTAERSAQVPDVPTVAEAAGLPDYDLSAWFALFAPAFRRGHREDPQPARLRARLADTLGMVVRTTSPEQAARFVQAETIKWTAAIRAAGIEPE
jgi:tripartite-type tricarboxylate transporter receptor subunit TctC